MIHEKCRISTVSSADNTYLIIGVGLSLFIIFVAVIFLGFWCLRMRQHKDRSQAAANANGTNAAMSSPPPYDGPMTVAYAASGVNGAPVAYMNPSTEEKMLPPPYSPMAQPWGGAMAAEGGASGVVNPAYVSDDIKVKIDDQNLATEGPVCDNALGTPHAASNAQ